mgnify:CR=1 FL=1
MKLRAKHNCYFISAIDEKGQIYLKCNNEGCKYTISWVRTMAIINTQPIKVLKEAINDGNGNNSPSIFRA